MKKVTDLFDKENIAKLPIHSFYWEYINFIPNSDNSIKKNSSERLNKNISRVIEYKIKNNE